MFVREGTMMREGEVVATISDRVHLACPWTSSRQRTG